MLCTRILANAAHAKYTLPAISQLQAIHRLAGGHERRVWGDVSSAPMTIPAIHLEASRSRYCTSATGLVNDQEKQQQTTGILKRVLTKVGFSPNSKSRLKVASHILYESVADKINYLNFFRDFHLPNTFNSWFLVTELHVWMLLVRSMAEGSESGEDGRYLRNCIVEAMWGDVNTRAKKLGANNPSRTRQQIEILSEQFQAALIAYDEGVMSDDRVLAAALWRRFFEMNCDDYEKIERLVKYVRKQIVMLDNLQRDEFLSKPKIPWLNLDNIKV